MSARIHQLPPAIANQIAAGEVIERPASIVKELLENSFDAGATSISIEIGYGGLNQIKMSDNGVGIVAEDLPLALSAHATSKITTLDDLYAIHSMGFRGEALASIASVAKVTLISRTAEQDHGMMLKAFGNDQQLSPCARTLGTTVDVSDIFYNAPVRKRFLKSEKIEFQAIETVVKRFALSAPNISISLKHNGKLILSLPAGKSSQDQFKRMSKIFGNPFVKDAMYLDVERAGIHLKGWISGHHFQKSQNDKLWVYVNNRMVKDKLIHHALKQVYEPILHPGRFPACLLYLTIPSSEVDVNVHPTKHEVRFQQPRLIHDFLTSQLTEVLNSGSQRQAQEITEQKLILHEPQVYFEEPLIRHFVTPSPRVRGEGILEDTLVCEFTKVSHRMNENSSWIFLTCRHVLMFIQQIPYLIDIIAFFQKEILYQLTQASLPLAHRPLLVPVKISELFHVKKMELIQCLSQLGLQIECPDDNTFIIRSIPIQIPYLDIPLFFASLAKIKKIDLENILDLLSQSQTFDPRHLSMEERNYLTQSLKNMQDQSLASPFCKALSEEKCREFLYE